MAEHKSTTRASAMRHELLAVLDAGGIDAVEAALRSASITPQELGGLLQYAAWAGRADVIPLLVEHGAPSQARNENGWAPMHLAVENSQLPAVRALLALGANVDERTSTGMTPLQLAVDVVADAAEQQGTAPPLDLIRALLEYGADPDAQDDFGDSARSWAEATQRNDLIALVSAPVPRAK